MPTDSCPTCAQPRTAHANRCPQGEIDRLRDEVQILQVPGSAYGLGQQRQSDVDSRAMDRLRARVAELEAAAVANARRWTQELGRLGQRANTADTQLAAALDRLDQVRGELTTTQRDHAAAITRIRDLRAAATAANQRADELLWIEQTSCCGSEANQYGVRARKAEAQVAAVRQALDELAHAGGADGQRFAVGYIRAALDAANTPASPTNDVSSWVGNPCQCGHPRDGHHQRPPEWDRSMWDQWDTCLDEDCDCERYEPAETSPTGPSAT